MTGTLFFVHGTGVRTDGYTMLIDAVRDRAADAGLEVTVVGVPWGDTFGVSGDRIADTLPAVSTRSLGEDPIEVDSGLALWEMLRDDPLIELRIAGEGGPAMTGASIVVGAARPDQQVRDLVAAAATAVERGEIDLASAGVTTGEVGAAITRVRESDELGEAARTAGSAEDPVLLEAVARACIATLLATLRLRPAGTYPPVLVDAVVRDHLVEQVAALLIGDGTRGGPIDWVKKRATRYAAKKATAIVRDRRQSVMSLANPAVGDILFYQRRGELIRAHLAEHLVDLEPPVVAVGHSLGGIALVELLAERSDLPVELLVTVGSQAPLFYAIDALGLLRPGENTVPFTPWLNVYNPSDFLSFRATGVFPGNPGITDVAVDPGVPFPESHSAYWAAKGTWRAITGQWPDA